MASRFVALLVVFSLAACAGGPHQPLTPPTLPFSYARVLHHRGELLVRVKVPYSRITPHYVGPSSKGITVSISGPTHVSKSAGLTVNARGCKSVLLTVQCSLSIPGLANCPSSKPCYTGSVDTYDKFDAAKNKIPKNARKLSADQHFKFSIQGGITIVPLVLEGIPKTIALIPAADTALTGSQSAGFTFPKCTTAAQQVSVVSLDADGSYIVGIGAPSVSLQSDDTAQLSVKKIGRASPTTFALVPPVAPAYPFGNFTVHLTATAKPGAQSGATAVNAVVNVTYSGDICGVFTEFNTPTAGGAPYGITVGPDANIWFTEVTANKIARMTTAGTDAVDFSIPTTSAGPIFIAAAADGNLWFTEATASKIGRITTAGAVTEFPTLTASAYPIGITPGPDGNVWFTEEAVSKIGKVTTSGSVSEYTIPTTNSNPFTIAAGSDGDLWFTEEASGANKIGRVTTSGTFTELNIPTAAASAAGIAPGSDGALWFAECSSNKIGRVVPSTLSPTIGEFALPTAGSGPAYLVAGPDGAMWFTEFSANRIARLAGTGTVTEYSTPTSGSNPTGITVGPDGAIWFAELNTNKIGRLR